MQGTSTPTAQWRGGGLYIGLFFIQPVLPQMPFTEALYDNTLMELEMETLPDLRLPVGTQDLIRQRVQYPNDYSILSEY